MDLFALWREQEQQSSMQRLQVENARLRRKVRRDAIVYWSSLCGVVVFTLVKLYGGSVWANF